MTHNNHKFELQVYIKPVENKEGEFLAFYQSDIYDATLFLYFKDNIMGSIALNSFLQMLRWKYKCEVDLCVLKETVKFQSQAILDIVTKKLILSQTKKS